MNEPALILTFREQFVDDDAVVTVDGGDPIRISGMTTKLLTGLAAEVPVRVVVGSHRVAVALPAKQVESAVDLEVKDEAELRLEVWFQDGVLSLVLPGAAAGYL